MAAASYSRIERFARVGSTNDVVRDWLADGLSEVAVAIADEQAAGRGRAGRTWTAPAGTSLLLSAGFRPTYLAPDAIWRLGAIVGLAMAEAAEDAGGLAPGTIGLKWPNDLAVASSDGLRKVGGVLGESVGIGTPEVRAVVGIGVDVDWAGHDVPSELADTMTTLSAVAGHPVSAAALADRFLDRLAADHLDLVDGDFPVERWSSRQLLVGRTVVLELPDGSRRAGVAEGVDEETGALLLRATGEAAIDAVHVADVVHVRLGPDGL